MTTALTKVPFSISSQAQPHNFTLSMVQIQLMDETLKFPTTETYIKNWLSSSNFQTTC